MSEPKRIRMTRQRPWRAEHPDAVIVARPSRWGNPFKVGARYLVFNELGWGSPTDRPVHDGEIVSVVEIADREQAVSMFRAWMHSCLTTAAHPTDLSELRGRDLACWCPLEDADGNRVPCHADVLLELANPKETP